MTTRKAKVKTPPKQPVTLDEMADEAGALGDDLGYLLVECAQCGVEVPGELAARAELVLRRACSDLASLTEDYDGLIPRPDQDGRGRRFSRGPALPNLVAKRGGDAKP